MSETYASPDDLVARWRPLSEPETLRAQTLLEAASRMVRAEFPGIDNRVAAGALESGLLSDVVVQMVQSAMAAPAIGVSQASEAAGPFNQAVTYANPAGDLYFTKSMRRLLGGRRTGRAFSLDLTPGAS